MITVNLHCSYCVRLEQLPSWFFDAESSQDKEIEGRHISARWTVAGIVCQSVILLRGTDNDTED